MGLGKPLFNYSKSKFFSFTPSGAPSCRDFPMEGGRGVPYRIVSRSLDSVPIEAKKPAFLSVVLCSVATAGAKTPAKRFPEIINKEDFMQSSVESGTVKILFTKTAFDML
jgi:hypothetical protein